jgi:hypothetical protein
MCVDSFMMIFQCAIGFQPWELRSAKVDLTALKTTLGLARLGKNPNKDKTLFEPTQKWRSGRAGSRSRFPLAERAPALNRSRRPLAALSAPNVTVRIVPPNDRREPFN